jgi:(2Fe-2S) ferredoxin
LEPPLPKPHRHVLVCTNTRPPGNRKGSCGEKGSEALFEALKAMLRERGWKDRVIVNRTSCLKHCSRGITLAVQPDNVWYAGVTGQDLEELCASHIEEGRGAS